MENKSGQKILSRIIKPSTPKIIVVCNIYQGISQYKHTLENFAVEVAQLVANFAT